MSIRKLTGLLFLVNLFFAVNGFCGGLVTISRPAGTVVSEKEQLLEGKVEEPFIKSLKVTVEPFLVKDQEKGYERKLEIKDGFFSENIILFPGLNLIRITTLTGRELESRPVFLLSADKKLFGGTEKWGSQSPIFFLDPAETKVSDNPVEFKAVVTDPAIKSLDVVVVDTADLLTEKNAANGKTGKIDYYRLPVNKQQQFNFSANLKEGLNIILAKVNKIPATTETIRLKSIIYEKASPGLILDEPALEKNKILIHGRLLNKRTVKSVRVKILALVEKREKPGNIFQAAIFDKTVDLQSDGSFSLKAPWELENGRYIIKSSPTIYVYAGEETVTKTLIKWW